jgi:hypothetical protein
MILVASGANAAVRIVRVTPRMQYVGVHGTYSITVEAAGENLQYHWWHKEPDAPSPGHAISVDQPFTVKSPTLTVTDAQMTRDYNGLYSCVVTDASTGRAVRSAFARVKVIGPPIIRRQPRDRLVRTGQDAFFQVGANATAPVPKTYQWYFEGRPISGATTRVLRLFDVTPAQRGYYSCRVTTIGGTTSTGGAFLDVQP